MRTLSKLIYFIIGWKAVGSVPKDIKKAVFIVAPHTSALDFYIGRFYCWINRLPMKVLIKKEAFKGPLGSLLKKVGGIPIDRSKATSKVTQIVNLFNEHDAMFLTIAPEGTRKYNDRWKMGFYHIAVQAKVPILLSFLDYEKKEAGIGPPFYPTGDVEKDFKEIENYYRGKKGRHPERFNLD